MPDLFDDSLLTSPLPERDLRPNMPLRALGVVAIAVLVGGLSWWVLSGDGSAGSAVPTTTDESIASTSSTVASVQLEVVAPDPPVLYHPTLLPAGWELCRALDDSAVGDRFCDPNDSASWVQVSLEGAGLVGLDAPNPTGDDHGGVWLDQGDYNEVGYLRAFVYVVVANRGTIPPDTLLEVAASIPMVASFDDLYGRYEVPLDLSSVTDDQLVALLSGIEGEATVVRRPGEAQVFKPRLFLYAFWGDGLVVPDFPASIPQPRLVAGDRPILVGETTNGQRGYALWDQGGYGWRIEGQINADEAAMLAVETIGSISQLAP
ncbi:MAG: hypothetical protein KJN71_05120 [Acidimicrobiia bacterium]|nr:hypothetical protein [Acidimicrobiia bacterium]NNC75102.1 hypothetical protein [Acidimicrobiia bacterium]